MKTLVALALALPLSAAPSPAAPQPAAPPPTAAEAKAFVDRVNADLLRLYVQQGTADWVRQTYITDDTERLAADATAELMAYQSRATAEAVRFDGVQVDPDTRRMLTLLKTSTTLPAPSDAARREELAALAARLDSLYGKGKYCPPAGKGAAAAGAACKDLLELELVLAKERRWDRLEEAWAGWHAIAREMRPLYERFVTLGNEGAREIGFADLGELWRAKYDMPPAAFPAEADRLWEEVRPLYEELHCHVRAELAKRYKGRIPARGPIPAHLLGNMWAQSWGNLYADMLVPYPGVGSLDVDGALARARWDAARMARTGEAFFASLGLRALPASFYQRSLFVKPRDREVVCHASAWNLDFDEDVRIKMCIRPLEEDLVTIHHELGHNYYQLAYRRLPLLFQDSANDGFHEALGDAVALSITPGYLRSVGLVSSVPRDPRAVVNFQMKMALEKIAFLPFGLLVDRWRWDVFSGKTPPGRYNEAWWELRRRYQGVAPPSPRTEKDFDPGAKYHVPANVPYTRYFLAHVYQFAFHEALCDAAGWKGPLHACSIHGSKEAGARLQAMMELGLSRPWPEAYEALTGKRTADASALLEYFAPLRAWLAEQNQGRSCGWE
jgi:peptidyl-dipeptidase A